MATLKINQFPRNKVLDYDKELRGQLQNGDVLICSGSRPFSKIIQHATGSVWSHVGFILELKDIGRMMVLESVESIGVRTVRLSKYLTGYDKGEPYEGGLAIIRHKQFNQLVDHKKLKDLAEQATFWFGHSYDRDEIITIAARIVSGKKQPAIEADKQFICSEYVARCFSHVGIDVVWNQKGFIAPSDFAADPNFELVGVMKKK